MSAWFISFADKTGSRGVTVVRATDPASALRMVNAARINPGGEALIVRIPPNVEAAMAGWNMRLVPPAEARRFDREHPNLVKANEDVIPETYCVCRGCNEAQMISCVHRQ